MVTPSITGVTIKVNPSFPRVTIYIVLKAKGRAWHASLRNGGRETRNTNDVAPTLSDTRGAQVVHLIVVEEDGPVPICVTDDRGVGVGAGGDRGRAVDDRLRAGRGALVERGRAAARGPR